MIVSFCIPTYNRKDFLEELLNSINDQKVPNFDIEVCISDNASTDGTESMIEIWRQNFNFPIVYHRNSENLGPDRNFLASVSLASGDYCWIFGSDDALADDALITLESYLHSNADVYLCDRSETGYDLSKIKNPHRNWLNSTDHLFMFNSAFDRANYFNKCLSIGGVFSYLSSIIVKRSSWEEVDFDDSFFGTSYPHVYIMMSIFCKNSCRLHYLNKPLVICRGDNDSFVGSGKTNRIAIDFVAYFKFSERFFSGSDMLKKSFDKILLRERPWIYTSLSIACYGNSEDKNKFSTYYNRFGYNAKITNILYYFGDLARIAKKNDVIKKIVKKILN
ncbi:glycosyltransferase family 2 protein [Citrobacter freundii]|uniref:glycosyltransferase family 2 protein n=1 Tax=Citrobacter freundii TaxID=546 RepID=UPI000A3C17BD|nr:glycosyltransferase family 2 protein [Citrobacter freundii]OUE69052.1 hypothetical protein AZ007_002128 [Citrobacter freundii]